MAAVVVSAVLALAPIAVELIQTYGPIVYELVLKIVARDMTLPFLKNFTSAEQLDKLEAAMNANKKKYISLPLLFNVLGAPSATIVLGKILAEDVRQINAAGKNQQSGIKSESMNPDVAGLTQLVVTGLQKSKYLAKGEDDDEEDVDNYLIGNDDDDDMSKIDSSFVSCLACLLNHVEFKRLCRYTAESRMSISNNDNNNCSKKRKVQEIDDQTAASTCRRFIFDGDCELEQKWRTVLYKVKQSVLNTKIDGSSIDDSKHNVRQMFEDMTWQNTIHLLHYLTRRAVRAPCVICHEPDKLEHMFFDLWTNRHDLYNVLNVFYNCDLVVANEFVHFLKPPCYPDDGTYPWDMNIFMSSLFKYHNYFKVYQPVTYHGVLYSAETSQTNLEIFAGQIINSSVRRHAFLVACGTIHKPTHWCGLFIDTSISTAFFFNSIAHEHQLDWKLVDVFNNVCNQMGLEYLKINNRITNKKRLQGKSNLCGHFVYDFFSTMLRQPSYRLQQVFKEYTDVPDELNKKSRQDILDSQLHTKSLKRWHFLPAPPGNKKPDRMFYSYLKKMNRM